MPRALPNRTGYTRGTRARLITYDGRSMSIAAWAKEIGVDYSTLYGRLKDGMSVHLALTTPLRARSQDRNRIHDSMAVQTALRAWITSPAPGDV